MGGSRESTTSALARPGRKEEELDLIPDQESSEILLLVTERPRGVYEPRLRT